ncbi:MAG: tetratricopeptide repeat protein [Opitutae bacterium]|nr:tetratricopeptide repeat protein [Opitutae bacterium]
MSADLETPEKGSGPQKISLPPVEKSPPPYRKAPTNGKPGRLFPAVLMALLGLGIVLIFQFRPDTDESNEDTSNQIEESTDRPSNEPESTSMLIQKPFIALDPESLADLRKKANQAVLDQASVDHTHDFQRNLFGKAAFLVDEANDSMDQKAFKAAQEGYEEALVTIEVLRESYLRAEEIGGLQSSIENLDTRLRSEAASSTETEAYQTVKSDLLEADTLLKNGEIQIALSRLGEIEAKLQSMIEQGEKQFQASLRAGLDALNSGDGDRAKELLVTAQALRPDDPFVAQQLNRAENINQVYAHFKEGRSYEDQGLYSMARVEYQKALDLDPDSVNINSRLQAINQALNQEIFESTARDGMAALAAGNGNSAVELLEKATALMPGDIQARNALKDARELQRRQRVDQLVATGKQELKNQAWLAARDAFEEALDYEPASQAAQDGFSHAQAQIEREAQLKVILLEAESFERNGELDKALIVLREGRQIADPLGAITKKIKFLEEILAEQSKPQQVRILSDNLTSIQIYQVGKFDPFHELNLELRPGKYTVVGSRLMYRDVRHTLWVEVGESPKPLEVICKEKL